MLPQPACSLLAVCIASLPLAAFAQVSFPELSDARGYAAAHMSLAVSRGTQALYGNPATLSFDERFEMELSGAMDFTKNSYKFAGLGIANSKLGPVALASSYHLLSLGPPGERSMAHFLTMAVAIPIAEIFHIGLSGQHLIFGPQDAYLFNLNVGIGINLMGMFNISLSAHNLFSHSSVNMPRCFALSNALIIPRDDHSELMRFTLEMRGNVDSHKPGVMLGTSLEYLFIKEMTLRFGYAYDHVQRANLLGVGASYASTYGGVDLGYRYTFNKAHNHVLALTGRLNMPPYD
ncbi:MAG: hypothetical protein FWD46_04840 [Cystobacterineae bacterium]|nr:hypothetical protein [Cystobacterineae bacterium]